jgi:hypothetical protein
MKFLPHVPAWLSAAQLPIQATVLAYVGAGGLAGAAVVGGVMLSPAREVVEEAVAPARQFVESVVPMTVPMLFPSGPQNAVASLPPSKTGVSSTAVPTAVATPLVVVEEELADSTPTAQPDARAPLRSAPAAQPTFQPGPVDPSLDAGPPLTAPAIVLPPVAAVERAAPVLPVRPAAVAVEPALQSSHADLAADARARATTAPASPRSAIGNSNSDNLRTATLASTTPIVISSAGSRATDAPPTATAVPTAVPPTQAPTAIPPTAIPPTQAPTSAPTQAPTQEPKKTSVPTPEPKATAVPTRAPTKVPPRPVKATPEPPRAAPAATAVKEKEKEKVKVKEKEKEKRPTQSKGRDQHDQHGNQSGDNARDSG